MIATFIVFVVWNGCVLSLLWDWFLVPYGMRPISVTTAMGFSLIVRFLTMSHTSKSLEAVELAGVLGSALINTTVVLALGYVVSLFGGAR